MIANILPQGDKIVILKVPGTLIKDMLENAVSAYPKLDGRFGAFAGVKFSFDPAQPAGSQSNRRRIPNTSGRTEQRKRAPSTGSGDT